MDMEGRIEKLEAEVAATKSAIVAQQIGLVVLVDRLSAISMTFDRKLFADDLKLLSDSLREANDCPSTLHEALAALAVHVC